MSIAEAYSTLKAITVDLNMVREEFIINEVGRDGLELMIDNNMIECCGDVNGHPLYLLKA